MADHILLIGMMGAGKTTVGEILAGKLDRAYIDNDTQVEYVTGKTVAQIWRDGGEEEFRRHESAALRAATRSTSPSVIAVAGGAVLDPVNRKHITAAGRVVWLRARVETLAPRLRDDDDDHRPLLSGPIGLEDVLEKLERERRPLYAELADVVVDVDDLTLEEVKERVLTALGS
ncbi:MAG TPA: shikimate kinase [Acidimicrobiales bacterium]|nr:shikimate kinase [Acidimicrobiales bacterium]